MATSNLPPRQKMINLIYVILLAMMAINVSSDVMQGFSVLSSHTQQQNGSLAQLNRTLQEKCTQEKAAADSIRQLLDEYTALTAGLREEIARNADKDDYTPGKLIKAEDMKAVPFVMLAPSPPPTRNSCSIPSCRQERRTGSPGRGRPSPSCPPSEASSSFRKWKRTHSSVPISHSGA